MNRRALLGLAATVPAVALAARPAVANDGKAVSTASYIRLSTATATVTRPDRRRGVMTVETGVDVPDAALRARAEQSAPRLRAAYNAVVQRNAAALLPGLPPDVERLARELQAATNTVLGRVGAKLLLGTVMVV